MNSYRRHGTHAAIVARPRVGQQVGVPSHVRKRRVLPLLAVLAASAFVTVSLVNPSAGAWAATSAIASGYTAGQVYSAGGDFASNVTRDGYTVSNPAAEAAAKAAAAKAATAATSASHSAPAAGTPDPGTAQAIAFTMVQAHGWPTTEYDCLVSLWNKESHWNVYSNNVHTGAYGIPQALPGSKMASAGADWATNPATQITWGLGYIVGRYSTPCGAWAHSQSTGWY